MATEYPALNRIHVVGYSANDTDYPILNLVADPRVAGYKVPEDFSACPDKRYPNHIFTGAQPISGDQRVRHTWEIIPSPWVPFTRYDDDLGPIQGRRRSVKNEGQTASLTTDKRVTYEARDGSAIVYTELEETWSIKTDNDGNSLFPVKIRDFYDASRGAVEESRQLIVPTGTEEGTLENVDGIITQTSYEPYNEFLSVKIVQRYKVDGPQLVGKSTDNDGQLVTVTTQRKAFNNYVIPQPTATKTVEVSREDAESLVERIVETPEIFKANTFSVERPDPIPQKFRVAVPIRSSQEIVEGDAAVPALEEGEISKSEEQRNKFIKRISSTSRDQAVLPKTLSGKTTNEDRQEVTVTETLQFGNTAETPTATKTVESEALGDGNYIVRKTEVPEIFDGKIIAKEAADPAPAKFKIAAPTITEEETVEGIVEEPELSDGDISKSQQQVNKFIKRVRSTFRNLLLLPKTLTQKTTNNQGQVVTVSETLQQGDTTETPDATTTIQSEALGDGTFIVTKTKTPSVFPNKTIRKTREDITPQKFKAKQSDVFIDETVAGTISAPDSIILGTGEFAKSEEQVTEFVKRISTNTRDITAADTLTEAVVTNEGQVATRILSLSPEPQSIQPDALLVDGSIEALGDGRTIKTETRVGEVFGAKTLSAERPDAIPQKFRVLIPSETQQENIVGDVIPPILNSGEISKSEQQQTKFVKRVSTTTRNQTQLPKSLEQKTTNNEGQMAVVKETLQFGDTEEVSTAKKTVQSEALGDGNFVVTTTEIPEVFDGKILNSSKPDVIPERFRASIPNQTISEIKEGSSVSSPSLGENEIEKTAQRESVHTIKEVTVKRDPFYSTNELSGIDYEESFDLGIPFSERIATSIEDGISADISPLGDGKYLVREYDKNEIETPLDSFYESYPTRINLNLPKILKSIKLKWDTTESYSEQINDQDPKGSFASLTIGDNGQKSANISATPQFDLEFEDINGSNIFAYTHLFFIKGPVTLQKILDKCNADATWPVFKTKSYNITTKSVRVVGLTDVAYTLRIDADPFGTITNLNKQFQKTRDITNITLNIPPCIHGTIKPIDENGNLITSPSKTVSVKKEDIAVTLDLDVLDTTVTFKPAADLTETINVDINLSPTSPANIPRQDIYLVDSNVEPYKYGFFLVRAVTVDALQFADTP